MTTAAKSHQKPEHAMTSLTSYDLFLTSKEVLAPMRRIAKWSDGAATANDLVWSAA